MTPTPSRASRIVDRATDAASDPHSTPIDRPSQLDDVAGSSSDRPRPQALAGALRRWLVVVVGVVALLGLGAELAFAWTTWWVTDALVPELSLSGEGNVPTWVSSMVLFACALAAGSIARSTPSSPSHLQLVVLAEPGDATSAAHARAIADALRRTRALRRGWWGVCAVFAYASLDETVQVHEHLGGHLRTGGVLYYDWIIPAVAIVVVLALGFLPFMRALPGSTRLRLIVAGAIYLGGAIAMELPLGWWTERHGVDGLGYALIDWVEETLELVGASLALLALVAHREEAA